MLLRALVCVPVCAAALAGAAHLPETAVGPDGSVMVLVPAGEFVMGTYAGGDDAAPPHRRHLPDFYIDRTEVTVAQYARFVNETGTPPPPDWQAKDGGFAAPAGTENLPITNITWFGAVRYAVWAGKRLPTEAEWEKAARGNDGRLFPWGTIDDPARRHLADSGTSSTFHDIGPVGRFPSGASPHGCLDMSGNAWEWTSDWYDAYPGASARSVHFGRQYKVVRGGGGLGFYGAPNDGTCVQRARLAPYGAYDAVGFRCARDARPGGSGPDARQLLEEAQDRLRAALKPPAQLEYERRFEALRRAGRIPLAITGRAEGKGHVRAGVPLPQGMLHSLESLGLRDERGERVGVQREVLARWSDGSVRWALIDFVGTPGATYELDLRDASNAPARRGPVLVVSSSKTVVSMDTELLQVEAGALDLVRVFVPEEDRRGLNRFVCTMSVVLDDGATARWAALPADRMDVESAGPIHGVIRLQGDMGDSEGRPAPFRYDLRIHATAGSPRLHLLLTLVHHAARRHPLETPAPVIQVSDVTAGFARTWPASHVVFGTESGQAAFSAAEPVELLQPDDLHYFVGPPGPQPSPARKPDVEGPSGQPAATRPDAGDATALEGPPRGEPAGARAPGWMAAGGSGGWVILGIRHFWQNCPKALVAARDSMGVRLWAGDEPFPWEAGLAKTHEVVIELRCGPSRASGGDGPPGADAFAGVRDLAVHLDPLRAVMAPEWMCGTAAAGAIMPRSPESLRTFPYWEARRELDMWRWAKGMPAGFRDFGDAYMGGPYKGKNAFQNLEYDVPFNYLLQFIRTGRPWYLDAAEVMARHQADVDIDNATGRQWKHSPLHTTTEAEFGHVFCRGLLLHYVLTGERRSLDIARKLGDWMAPIVERGHGVGNERQIGWSLYALTGLYEVTHEARYLRAAEALCRRLMDGQAPTGRFNIRWDNRIAFFNGIAMNGMLTVAGHSGDRELAEAVLRVANRSLGFYPEYATRTLNAFCWALEQTGDARYLDALARCWDSSMEFLLDRRVESTETHSWKFPRFAARYGLFSVFGDGLSGGAPPSLPDPATWRCVRLRAPEATLYLRSAGDAPARVLVLREGLDQGRAELIDSRGETVERVELGDDRRLFQAAVLDVPAGAAAYRLRLAGSRVFAWQVQHDHASHLVVVDPRGSRVPDLMPRAFCLLREGAAQVRLRLEARGEGFHSAALYDPAGKPVSVVRHFIDFGDVNRYEIALDAAVSWDPGPWSLDLCGFEVLSVDGLLPYYAASPGDLFNPER